MKRKTMKRKTNLLLQDLEMKISVDKMKEVAEVLAEVSGVMDTYNREIPEEYLDSQFAIKIEAKRDNVTMGAIEEEKSRDFLEFDEELLYRCLGLVEKGRNKGLPIQIMWQAMREAEEQGKTEENIYDFNLVAHFCWFTTGREALWRDLAIGSRKRGIKKFFKAYPDVQEFKPKEKTVKKSLEVYPTELAVRKFREMISEDLGRPPLWTGIEAGPIIGTTTDTSSGEEVSYVGESEKEDRVFETGFRRDSDKGKPLTADLDPYLVQRFGYHMAHNAKFYPRGNWKKGQPTSSIEDSLDRHYQEYRQNRKFGHKAKEDHLSAMIFNIQMIMQNEEREGMEPNYFYNVS